MGNSSFSVPLIRTGYQFTVFVWMVKHWMKNSMGLYNLNRNNSEVRLLDLMIFLMQENQAAALQKDTH